MLFNFKRIQQYRNFKYLIRYYLEYFDFIFRHYLAFIYM